MDDLFAAALDAYRHAHAPYSGFAVGAAVRTASGRVFAGANVENASYPEGNCAETSALAAMVAAGEREVAEALVLASGARLITPCGGCRQRLAEFARADLPVHLCDPRGHRRTVTLGELLPLAFGAPDDGEATTAMDVIRARAPDFRAEVGLILGSGLGGLADALGGALAVDYARLPGFPRPTVDGHAGRLILGMLDGLPVACLQGRVHLYEGGPAAAVNPPVRTLRALGCETLIITNAAGSLRPEIGPGALVLIDDHINQLGSNPLVGPNDDALGPRFPDMSEVYDRDLRERAMRIAAREGMTLARGVYLATLGPSFETPAEIRAFRALGADLVGMSTVPEAISARHCGMRVLGLSIVTNLAAGLADHAITHEEALAEAQRAGAALGRLIRGLCRDIARHDHDPA